VLLAIVAVMMLLTMGRWLHLGYERASAVLTLALAALIVAWGLRQRSVGDHQEVHGHHS
jgi:uncharacterized membrane-anchored protein